MYCVPHLDRVHISKDLEGLRNTVNVQLLAQKQDKCSIQTHLASVELW